MGSAVIRTVAIFMLSMPWVAALGGEPGSSAPVAGPRGNFGGWATSRGRYTFTGNGLVGTSVGRSTFFDNGLTATRVGAATAYNNGLVSARIGRNEVFSNGVVGVPTRGGMVFTSGFGPATEAPAGRGAARHHAGHPDGHGGR
jgi:hypothetical protein